MNKIAKKLSIGLSLCLCVAGISGCGGNKTDSHEGHEHVEQVVSDRPDYPDIKALDYITLPDNYQHMEVTAEPKVSEITTEMIDEQILQQVSPESLDSGEVQMGDTVLIDLDGTIDGESFDGGTAEDYNLTIGSGAFIEGFEEQLVGMELNKDHPKEKTIRVVFPDDYSNEDLASQVATFKVKLKDIKRAPSVDSLTKEEIENLSGGDCSDIKAYRKLVKKDLQERYDEEYSNGVQSAMFDWLKENCKAKELPEELVNWYYDSVFAVYDDYAKTYGLELEEVFSSNGIPDVKDKESFIKYASSLVQEELLSEVIPQSIAEDLKITCTDDEYKTYVQDMMTARNYSGELSEFEKTFGKDCLMHWAITDKVYKQLEKTVVVTESTQSDVLTGNPEAALDEDGNLIPDGVSDNNISDNSMSENNENPSEELSSEGSAEVVNDEAVMTSDVVE